MSALPFNDEKNLLHKLQEGDRLAFEIIYHRYKGLLYVHASKHLKDQEEAKDIIHDIFSNLWQNRTALHIQENLTAYLYQAVRNRVINQQLKSQRADEYIDSLQGFIDHVQVDTDHRVREKMLTALIEHEIASLPPKMRMVFELSRKEGLSHKEIAEQLNISEQSVRSHVKGALKILRLRLGILFIFIYFTGI
ncbi:RNA polymerase sigma factor [Sphingobacterium chuzhouense]|uniref:RNA polymerase sigma-70 factor n=1 Tax=Sphingobacterium chuzhouense TaxID=1742264 RepID=A0ABR7XMW0_9SPHI|nr:RNA polymerase sigma-70 factor [Sphingobacterium chuzhouense]MBD1420172.1 RNA polymerase sigma-70 factor [Sphingobacterium chuzhouense]